MKNKSGESHKSKTMKKEKELIALVLPVFQKANFSAMEIERNAIHTESFSYEDFATESEIVEHKIKTGEASIEIEFVERKLEELKLRYKELQSELDYLNSRTHEDESGEITVFVTRQTEGVWVSDREKAYLVIETHGELKIAKQKPNETARLFEGEFNLSHNATVNRFKRIASNYLDEQASL